MPDTADENARRIKILYSVAIFIFNEGRGLFIAGAGEDIHGNDVANVVSEIETIPSDLDGYRWANAALRFIRYVSNVLALALQESNDAEQAIMWDMTQDLENIMPDDQSEI